MVTQVSRPLIILLGLVLLTFGSLVFVRNAALLQRYESLHPVRRGGFFDEEIIRTLDQLRPDLTAPTIVVGSGLLLLILGLFQYLQGSRSTAAKRSTSFTRIEPEHSLLAVVETNKQALAKLEQSLSDFNEQLKNAASPTIHLNGTEKSQVLEGLKKSVTATLTTDFMSAIDDRYSEAAIKNRQLERLLEDLNGIRERLLREVAALSRRANLNLVIGVGTTVLAVIGLLYVVFGQNIDLGTTPKDERLAKFLFYYVPRLSLIVFIEVFAYFFLRLYKAGLSDIKFYQNELTNIEVRIAALESSFMSADKEILMSVIGELSKTERNFILRKDETTVELEKFKREGINAKEWLEHIPALLKAKSSG